MISIAQRLRAARARSGLSQDALARAAGVMQAQISLYERGIVRPSDAMAERILRAAKPRPEASLERLGPRIRDLAERHGVGDVRVSSDADETVLLVTPAHPASPLRLGAFAVAVEDLLDYPIRVLDTTDPGLSDHPGLAERSRPLSGPDDSR